MFWTTKKAKREREREWEDEGKGERKNNCQQEVSLLIIFNLEYTCHNRHNKGESEWKK